MCKLACVALVADSGSTNPPALCKRFRRVWPRVADALDCHTATPCRAISFIMRRLLLGPFHVVHHSISKTRSSA